MSRSSRRGIPTNASINVLYAIVPETFPPAIRTTGTGWAMSVGRLGAVAGPSLAGVLIQAGWSRAAYFAALGVPMLLAAVCLRWITPSRASADPGRP